MGLHSSCRVHCSSLAGLYLSISVSCSSPSGLDSPIMVRYPSLVDLYSSKGQQHAISLAFQRRAAAMRLRVGISLEVDLCQVLLPSTEEYETPPSSEMNSDDECRDVVNIRNPMDSCMYRRNPVHVPVQLTHRCISCYKLFCCYCGV